MSSINNDKYISVYLRNHEEGPSCYYRVVQYINNISCFDYKINDALNLKDFRKNMDYKSGVRKKILQLFLYVKILIRRFIQIRFDLKNKPSIIIIQREIFPRFFPHIALMCFKKMCKNASVIWDFDDWIMKNGEISKKEWNILSLESNIVFATSVFLLKKVDNQSCKKIILPTTDYFCECHEIEKNSKKKEVQFDNEIRMVWVGTHSNLPFVIDILDEINKAGLKLKEYGKKLEMVIVCNIDHPSFYVKHDGVRIVFRKWTRDETAIAILESHIGIMPLPNDEYAKGKGGFKLIQYMSAGLPVIGTSVGINKQIIQNDIGILINNREEWSEAIVEIATDIKKWKKMSENSLNRYNQCYSYESNLKIWNSVINECMSSKG